jgi:imidazolonepropionase-like amidohydrolase
MNIKQQMTAISLTVTHLNHKRNNMSIRKPCILLLFALLLAGCAAPVALTPTAHPPTVQPTATQQNTLALVNGTLIDGNGLAAIPDAVVVIQGERIVAAGPKKDVEIPTGARVIDVKGATILPGFINAHVHFAEQEQNLQAWAYGGVTTVRNEGVHTPDKLEALVALRNAASRKPQNARIVSSGYMITVPNGYGALFVTSPEDARQKVFAELDTPGTDMIKIAMEDGYAGQSNLPKLTGDEIAAIISAAHERGTRVSGHITQAKYLKILVDAGVDDIAHIAYDVAPNEVWQAMVAKNIYMTPTFTVFRNYGAPVATCVLNLHNFLQQGGKVALGNDYGGGPGKFELGIPMYELEQMSAAGMTPMQVIVASTKNAAIVSGIEDQVGTLETGKIADILVVSANPLDDLKNLSTIRIVIHNGTIIRNEKQ